ncbi:hypothetical protein ACJQWK_01333 [Exserohilum turcicum]
MFGVLVNATVALAGLQARQNKNCPAQPTCPRWNHCVSQTTNGAIFRFNCNTDYNGTVITTAQANTFADCADACGRRRGCTAFNKKDNFCYLLGKEIGVSRTGTDVNAGVQIITATKPEPTPGASSCGSSIDCPNDDYCRYTTNGKAYIARCSYDYYGGDIAIGETPSLTECVTRCSIMPGCLAATWAGGMCYLKNGDSVVIYNSFADSVYLDSEVNAFTG